MEVEDLNTIPHEFLARYLRYVWNTESPRIYHVWCALSGISACLGRRCWYETGVGNLWPNMYIVLTGPPAVRKSSAISYVRNLLLANTGVRFAPDDTGGARQGLISAMTDIGDDGDEELAALVQDAPKANTFASLSQDDKDALLKKVNEIQIDMRDPRTMYIASSELNSFLGENNTQMLNYLIQMWDSNKSYQYRLRNANYELKDALLGILGATTPSQISLALPSEAIGQGFTSRIIFVHANQQYKRIPRPSLDERERDRLASLFSNIFYQFSGGFTETKEAASFLDSVYMRGIKVSDPRFIHYADRRHDHLRKAAMALAAGRGYATIELQDVQLADEILLWTEENMPEALGEFGMNKLSAAKQRLMDYIKQSDQAIPMQLLYSFMSRDMSLIDFKTIISDLHNTKRITRTVLPELGECIIAVPETQAKHARMENTSLANLLVAGRR